MNKYLDKYRIPTCRLKNHGYDCGIYFITICTSNKMHYLGEIVDGQMNLNEIGQYAEHCLMAIPNHYHYVNVAAHVVMPNHVHALLIIDRTEDDDFVPINTNQFGPQSNNLASIVRGYKAAVTTFARKKDLRFAWQQRFYDQWIRNDEQFRMAYEYINNNISKWANNQ